MLTEAVYVEPDRLGQLDLFDNLAETVAMADRFTRGWIGDRLGEASDSKFHGVSRPCWW